MDLSSDREQINWLWLIDLCDVTESNKEWVLKMKLKIVTFVGGENFTFLWWFAVNL